MLVWPSSIAIAVTGLTAGATASALGSAVLFGFVMFASSVLPLLFLSSYTPSPDVPVAPASHSQGQDT